MKKNNRQSNKQKEAEVKSKAYKTAYEISLILLFTIFLILSTTNKLTSEDDYYWHTATGRYIINTGTIPSTDPFSFSTEGQHWFATEWGWDVITYYIFQWTGPTGLSILTTLIYLLIYGMFYIMLRKFKVSNTLIILFFILLTFGIFERITPRPHIISYLFLTFILSVYINFKYFKRNTKLLYLLPIIFIIWANMHMGVLFGLVLLGICFISEVIIYLQPKKFETANIIALNKNELIKFAVIIISCGIVMLINPHGAITYTYAMSSHVNAKMLQEAVLEWHSPFNEKSFGKFHNIVYIVFLLSITGVYFNFKKRKDLAALLITLFFALNSLRALRFTVDYIIVGFVFIVISYSYLTEQFKGKDHRPLTQKPAFNIILSLLLIFLIVSIPTNKLYLSYLKYPRFFGFGIDKNYFPERMINFIKDNNIQNTGSRPFNTFEIGGYFLWNFPGKQNFFDGRDLNDFIMNEYQIIYSKLPGFEQKLNEWNFDYAVIAVPDVLPEPAIMKQTIISYFLTNPQWKLIWWSDRAFLFVKDIPSFSDIINKYQYKYINSYNYIFQKNILDKAVSYDKEGLKNEILRKIKEEPDGIVINSISRSYWTKVK